MARGCRKDKQLPDYKRRLAGSTVSRRIAARLWSSNPATGKEGVDKSGNRLETKPAAFANVSSALRDVGVDPRKGDDRRRGGEKGGQDE